ncbi:MAG: hypothetical protein JNM63_12505 [Spirochaetia bacterium]|nr:hypothetical protein [Spirochaetia bacterium]
MRSIGYVMGGRPSNLDDCFDQAKKKKPKGVSLELAANESVSQMFLVNRLNALFIWDFGEFRTVCEENLGGCFAHEGEERQKLSLENANERLAELLKKITKRGFKVAHHKKRFDASFMLSKKKRGS